MHKLCVFDYFWSKIIFSENYFLIAAINLTTWGPLYTCLGFEIFTFEILKEPLEFSSN